ncbi:MAG: rod shape-determining protein MreD [Gammaproteobacteria bacterium]|nr:rod shape-determining protein MreD [Gammaproteobacteria bacterium]CAJ2376284.1 MAG: Rod shape-determining protein MreD [Arenicellales bacterium IbO2]MDA7961640.1 rod shape-determining protein MreD [Gammaproteobacteria bacterium]MDA7967576.1 rod shape-determining protein MreD [Gammaproteobacteria bacterium]MDA7969793.1 rod shape-determining protein MreD [Gammaproteobacteria bacterium]
MLNKPAQRVEARWERIIATTALAVFLNVLPYPEWVKFARPDWVTLALFYWCLAAPQRVGVVYGWLCGLTLDLIHAALPGQYALGKALIALVAAGGYARLRLEPLWVQSALLLALASADTALVVWIHYLAEGIEVRAVYWLGALITALLWPLAFALLRRAGPRDGFG